MEYEYLGVTRRPTARAAAAIGLMLLTIAMGVTAARAASLGKLELVSTLGQPFHGRIDVLDASRRELDTLGARLGSVEAYRQAGVSYSAALEELRFNVAKRKGGRPYIKVTSSRPFGEPVVDLLVELAWFQGSSAYSYTFLVDPAGSAGSASAGVPPVVVQQPTIDRVARKKAAKLSSATSRPAGAGATPTVPKGPALTEQIRLKEEEVAQRTHRLAAAQERIAELQQTVHDQERLLSVAAAQAIANDMRPAVVPAVARVSHESNPRPAATPPASWSDMLSEPLYLGGGAAAILLATLAFVRARRRRIADVDVDLDGEYSRMAPTLQPAS